MKRTFVLAGVALLLAACGESGAPAAPTPSPIDTYIEWSDEFGDAVFIEVTTQAALKDFLVGPSGFTVQQLKALPAGAEIACHRHAPIDNSPVTLWDDGTPGNKTAVQGSCNRLPG